MQQLLRILPLLPFFPPSFLSSDLKVFTCFCSVAPSCCPSHCCFYSHHFPLSLSLSLFTLGSSFLSFIPPFLWPPCLSPFPSFSPSPSLPPSLPLFIECSQWLAGSCWLASGGGYSFIIPLVFQTASPQCHRSLIFAIIICLFYLTSRQHNDLSAAPLSPLRVSSISKLTTVIREPRFR